MGRQSKSGTTATSFAALFEVDLELSGREPLNWRARRYACDRSFSEHSSRATKLERVNRLLMATADFELQRAGRGPGGETVTGAFGTLRKQLI
jgi:hypothetical protein